MSPRRFMASPCCRAAVSVPVDVTAHIRVLANGTMGTTLTDTMRGFSWAAQHGDADLAEAYCEKCGQAVRVHPKELLAAESEDSA